MKHEYLFGVVPQDENEPQYKSVFSPKIARHLLRMGNPVHDIKADKSEPQKTIFIFEKTAKFDKDLAVILSGGDSAGKA